MASSAVLVLFALTAQLLLGRPALSFPTETLPFLLPSSPSRVIEATIADPGSGAEFKCLFVDRKHLLRNDASHQKPERKISKNEADETRKRVERFAEASRVLNSLKGQCTDRLPSPASGYVYDVCIGESVTQRGGGDLQYMLGKRLLGDDDAAAASRKGGSIALIQTIVDGDRCPSSDRKAIVRYVCGDRFTVLAATEPSTCTYHLRVSVPQLCAFKEAIDPLTLAQQEQQQQQQQKHTQDQQSGAGAGAAAGGTGVEEKPSGPQQKEGDAKEEDEGEENELQRRNFAFSVKDEVARLLGIRTGGADGEAAGAPARSATTSAVEGKQLLGALFPKAVIAADGQDLQDNTADAAGVGGASLGKDKREGERWTGLDGGGDKGGSTFVNPQAAASLGVAAFDDPLGNDWQSASAQGMADKDGEGVPEESGEPATWLLEARLAPAAALGGQGNLEAGGAVVLQCLAYKTDDLRRQAASGSKASNKAQQLENLLLVLLRSPSTATASSGLRAAHEVVEVRAAQLTGRTSNRRLTFHDVELAFPSRFDGEGGEADTEEGVGGRAGWRLTALGGQRDKRLLSKQEEAALMDHPALRQGDQGSLPLLVAAYQPLDKSSAGIATREELHQAEEEGVEFLTVEAMLAT